jgi:hypothetical protein
MRVCIPALLAVLCCSVAAVSQDDSTQVAGAVAAESLDGSTDTLLDVSAPDALQVADTTAPAPAADTASSPVAPPPQAEPGKAEVAAEGEVKEDADEQEDEGRVYGDRRWPKILSIGLFALAAAVVVGFAIADEL